MKIRRINSLLLVCMIIVSLFTSCSPKRTTTGNPTIDNMTMEELGDALVRALNERSAYKASSEQLQAQVDDLYKMVQGVQVADPEFPAISEVEDGTGRLTFTKPGDYIKLPDPLRIPGDVPIEVNNKIAMGGPQGITLQMAPVWAYRIEGNKLWLSSSTGVYGAIVIGKMEGALNMEHLDIVFDGSPGQAEERDDWDRIIKPYIPKTEGLKKSVPADPGKSAGIDEAIYWRNTKVGRQIILNTSIDGESAVFRAGAFVAQDVSVIYTFVYETESNVSNEAIILTAIQSIAIQNAAIAVAH